MKAARSSKRRLPLIAIIGRPNVGKSTLFNRIIGKQRAIVHGVEGITRDRFIENAEWHGRAFRVVDTGGIVEQPLDEITRKMQEQVQQALEEAAVILFVVDGQEEITRVDHFICESVQRMQKPVVLAINKLDNPALTLNQYEYYALGLGEPLPISSGHNVGVDDLMRAVVQALPEAEELPDEAVEGEDADEEAKEDGSETIKVAVVGRPNVGKSSFINALLNQERTIVSDIPGTTRDAIDIRFSWQGKDYILIDTAGLRRRATIRRPVEHFSVARSLRAMRRADVCLIMLEATEGIAEQDKRIIGYALEQGTAFILVWTKWDLVEDKEKYLKKLEEELDLKMPQISFAPLITISNETRTRLFKVFDLINEVSAESEKRIATAEINKLLEKLRAKHNPPGEKGRHAKIRYATQVSVKPTTFMLFVNQKRLFHFSYIRFLENQLREQYGFTGVPIKLELKEEKRKK